MSENNQDAAHAATAARLDRAWRDGDVAKSRELAAAVQLVFVIGSMYWLASNFFGRSANFATEPWSSELAYDYNTADLQQQLVSAGVSLAAMLLPLLGVVLVSVVVSNLMQTGPMLQGKRVQADVTRLSPANWFKRLFSGPSLARTILGLPKFLIVISVSVAVLWAQRNELVYLSTLDVGALVREMTSMVLGVAAWVAVALLLISGFDYALERASYAARLRMSDRELRDEQRTQNVDPVLTSRRRQIHRDLRG